MLPLAWRYLTVVCLVLRLPAEVCVGRVRALGGAAGAGALPGVRRLQILRHAGAGAAAQPRRHPRAVPGLTGLQRHDLLLVAPPAAPPAPLPPPAQEAPRVQGQRVHQLRVRQRHRGRRVRRVRHGGRLPLHGLAPAGAAGMDGPEDLGDVRRTLGVRAALLPMEPDPRLQRTASVSLATYSAASSLWTVQEDERPHRLMLTVDMLDVLGCEPGTTSITLTTSDPSGP